MAILELEAQRRERKDILKKKLDDARRKAEQEEARKKRKAAEWAKMQWRITLYPVRDANGLPCNGLFKKQ